MIRTLPTILLLFALLLPRPLSAIAAGEAPGVVGQLGGPLSAVAATDQTVYAATGRRLFALGVADPAHPAPLGPGLFLPAAVRGVAVAGSLAYVADGNAGLRILDLSSPGRPVERGVLPGPTTGVAVAGALAFVLGATELRVVDVRDPAQPKLVGAFPAPGQPSAVVVVGGGVYLGVQPIPMAQGAAGAGLYALDVRDPAHPTVLARFPGAVEQLLAAGDHLYYSAPDQRTGQPVLHVLDVADPRAPQEVAALPGLPGITAAEGARLFAIDRAGLQIFDASDPAQPRPLGAFQVAGQFRGVVGAVVAGAYAYAWAGDNALHVVSLADPRHPVEVGVYQGGPSHANGVAVAGRYAYVANGFDTALDVLDVGDPARPAQVGAANLGGSVQGVAVQGAYAYAALITGSLVIVDVSDPTRPRRSAASPPRPPRRARARNSGRSPSPADTPISPRRRGC